MEQKIIAIYAVSENGVIGKDNDLPWRLRADMLYFKRLTTGKPIIMGRKSFDSLGKPLPNRRNIVVTRNRNFKHEGIEVVHSLEDAISLCKGEPEVWITGGAGIYKESIDKGFVSIIYETLVHADVDGDTFFSLSNENDWEIVSVDSHQSDEKNEYAYTFKKLIRK